MSIKYHDLNVGVTRSGGGGNLQQKTFTRSEIEALWRGPLPAVVLPDSGYDGFSLIEIVNDPMPTTWDLVDKCTGILGRAQYANTNTLVLKGQGTVSYKYYFIADSSQASGWRVRGDQTSNTTGMFDVAIPAGYNKLYINIESGGSSGRYNLSTLYLQDAYGITGYNGGNFAGNRLMTVQFCNYGMTAAAINAQQGVTINSTSPYSLSRQTVVIDISSINVDTWVGWHRCDNWTTIYSIIAAVE